MVDATGLGALQREAMLAAMQRKAAEIGAGRQRLAAEAEGLRAAARPFPAPAAASAPTALPALAEVDAALARSERLAEDVVAGRVTEFHEIAAEIKRADLALKFSLEIRNKLIDAYREVMRMSV